MLLSIRIFIKQTKLGYYKCTAFYQCSVGVIWIKKHILAGQNISFFKHCICNYYAISTNNELDRGFCPSICVSKHFPTGRPGWGGVDKRSAQGCTGACRRSVTNLRLIYLFEGNLSLRGLFSRIIQLRGYKKGILRVLAYA